MALRRRKRRTGPLPPGTIALVRQALREDRVRQDRTTRLLFPRAVPARGRIVAQASGILSGVEAAAHAARAVGLAVRPSARDGARIRRRQTVLTVQGDGRRILGVERTLLNFVMHLSGIATATGEAVQRARRSRPGFRVLATRKTIPGLRHLEKAAVVHGGGEPHRRDLSAAILIKNNHLALLPLARALATARAQGDARVPIEVEVRSLAGARRAVRGGASSLLVDNLSPRRARRLIRALRRGSPSERRVPVELSGGIELRSIARYARTGADSASLGSLTHSAPALPFHLVIEPARTGRRRLHSA